jgi:hypothetical protein
MRAYGVAHTAHGVVTTIGVSGGLMDHGCDDDQPGEHHEGDHGPFRWYTGHALSVTILMPPTVTIAVPQTPAHDSLLAASQHHVTITRCWELGLQTGLMTVAHQMLMQVATRDIRQLTDIEGLVGVAVTFPRRSVTVTDS